MHPDAVATDLAATVDRLVTALETLIDDLIKEREALRRRSGPDDLEYVALRKSMAVEHVSDLYAQLRALLVAATGGGRIEDAFAHLRELAPGMGQRAERLVELTRACQLANQENGALIGAGLKSTEGALDTLRDLGADRSAATYGAHGHTRDVAPLSHGLTVRA